MPYETYNPYGNRRFVPYQNEGQSLLNFSTFQPTFIGQPIQEMGAAYKAYRDTADMILDTGDALGQTLSQMNVDPKDRPMLAQKKLELDSMLKDVAATGDFAPARVKMRNVLNTVKQDQFYPAAENKYAMKLKAIEEANKKAGDLKVGPERLGIYLNKVENSFNPTVPDPVTGMYNKEFIAPPLPDDFDYHTFLSQFMSNETKKLTDLGLSPIYVDIKTDPNDPNSPTVKRLFGYGKGTKAEITVDELKRKAVDALSYNEKAMPTTTDLADYYKTTKEDFLKTIVRPYAETFSVDDKVMDYIKATEYDNTTPNYSNNVGPYPPQITTVPGIVTKQNPMNFSVMQAYNQPTPTASYYTNPGDETRTSAPKYNVAALPENERKIAYRMLENLYGVTQQEIGKNYNTKRIQDVLESVYNSLTSLSTGEQIINNKAIQYVPNSNYRYVAGENLDPKMDDETYLTKKIFGINPGQKGVQPTPSTSLKNVPMYNLSTNEEITYDDLNDMVSYTDAAGQKIYPALRVTHELTPENLLPFVTGNYAYNRGVIVQVGDETLVIGTDPSEIKPEDILLNKISSATLAPGQLVNIPEFYNSKLITMKAGTDATGSPIYTYTTNIDKSDIASMDNDVSSQILNAARTRIAYDQLKSTNPNWTYNQLVSNARSLANSNTSNPISSQEQKLIDEYYTNNPIYNDIKSSGNISAFSSADLLNKMKTINPEIYFFSK